MLKKGKLIGGKKMKRFVLALFMILSLLFFSAFTFLNQAPQAPSLIPAPVTNLNFSTLQNGLKGEYYKGTDFTEYTSYRIDNSIDFNWGKDKAPIIGLNHDFYSVRWSGYLVPSYNEIYKLITKSDDGVRLYINGTLVINDWNAHGEKESSVNLQLVAGQPYYIVLEYFQYNGPASVKLYWSSFSQRKEIIPRGHLFTQSISKPAAGNGTGLLGSYFDGQNFEKLTSEKIDKTIDFHWSYPSGQLHNAFSIRWVGKIQPLYSDLYTFRTVSDDGIRLWINGQLIINNWQDGSSMEGKGSIQLQAGQLYDIKVEFYENKVWPATAKLYWSSLNQPLEIVPKSQLYPPPPPQPGNGTGLKAEYYSDKNFTILKTIKVDPDINFDWGNRGLPVDGVAHNNFSVRWSGKIQPLYSGTYTLKTVSDDGIRLWINGRLLIDDFNVHSDKIDTCKIDFIAGQMYDIRIDYFQESGFARAELYWKSERQQEQIVPQSQLYNY